MRVRPATSSSVNRRSWLAIGLVGLCCLAALWGVAGAGTGQTLVVATSGSELLSTPVDEGSTVVIEYTHSVERTLVRDIYTVENGVLVMTRMEFSSFGAGLPAQAEVTVENGRYVYEPPATRYDPLRITTGSIADHDMVVDGQRYDLAAMAEQNTVELRIQERRLLI